MTAIIFDIGGVLVKDIWEPLCFGPDGIAETYDLPREQFRDFATALNIEYARTPLLPGTTWQQVERECWERVIDEFSAYFPDSIIPEDLIVMTDDFIHPLNQSDIVELLGTLKGKGMKIGICSDMSCFLYARITNVLHLEALFSPEHIVVSYVVGQLKMDGARMLEAATAALGEDTTKCMFFDDRPVNIEMAHQLGIDGVLVPASSPMTSFAIRAALNARGILDVPQVDENHKTL
jgi:FMN phosphatase YigB (HAD superfamily)